MSIKYKTVDIRISELHIQRVSVPAWEVPVLMQVHGEGVTEVAETLVDRVVPQADDEFRRLSNRYRNTRTEDGSQGIPYVASVYGQFGVGTASLARAIAESVVESAPAPTADSMGDLIGSDKQSSVGG